MWLCDGDLADCIVLEDCDYYWECLEENEEEEIVDEN